MIFARFSLLSIAVLSGAAAQTQTCPNENSGQCDFDPFNPVACGADYSCGYDTLCLASENGFDIEADCCQAPQPSMCTSISDPQLCGTKQCPYASTCVAELAGYTSDQCESPPEECPTSTEDCSGEPSNPIKCGAALQCPYENFCLATSAGYNANTECCQDVRGATACAAIFAPVSCGPPQKQCPYDNQCTADAAGYNAQQCCSSVPEGTACSKEYKPVECGSSPCKYSNQCQATAAGYEAADCCGTVAEGVACTSDFRPVQCGDNSCEYSNQCLATSAGSDEAECCPVAQGACTQENDPVQCDGKCEYGSQSCADLAGFSSNQCCKQPKDVGSCTMEFAPIACSSANCIYDNPCIAELAGFDPTSCVKQTATAGTLASTANGNETATAPSESGACSRSTGPFGAIANMLA